MNLKLKDKLNVIIRKACEEDAEELLEYVIKTAGESDFVTVEAEEFDMTVEGEKSYISLLNNAENGLFIVAEVEGRIVGELSFYGLSGSRFKHSGELGMSVLRKYWGLGIGEELLEYLFHWAKESEIIRKINLKVRTDNERAVRLYHKMGFEKEGELGRDFFIKGHFYSSYFMGINID